MQTNNGAGSRFAPYAPPSKAEQIEMARQRGPADVRELEKDALFISMRAEAGRWEYGHLHAERLRLLAQVLAGPQQQAPSAELTPSSCAGQETIESLREHAKNGGVFVTPSQCYALANLILEYETSLAYALRRLEGRGEEVNQLQRTVADLAEQVEKAENDQEPIVFVYFFAEEAPADSLGVELGLELVSILDALGGK